MTTTTTPSNQVIQDRNQRVQWFQNDRFGMFIHWGLYSIPARGEWLRSSEQMSIEDYQTYFDEFDPVDYNPGMGQGRQESWHEIRGAYGQAS